MIGCRPLTDEELEQLQNDMRSTQDKALLVLCATTGFRISEALSLKVQDVALKGEALDRVTVKRRSMKGKDRSRTVLLHPTAKQGIEALIWERRLEPQHYLFKSQKGENRPIDRTQAWRRLKAAFARLGLQGKVATHSMRKYFAGQVYEALGRDIFKTSKALGHKHVSSTADYLSFKTEEIDAAVLTLMKPK
jgi:integrase